MSADKKERDRPTTVRGWIEHVVVTLLERLPKWAQAVVAVFGFLTIAAFTVRNAATISTRLPELGVDRLKCLVLFHPKPRGLDGYNATAEQEAFEAAEKEIRTLYDGQLRVLVRTLPSDAFGEPNRFRDAMMSEARDMHASGCRVIVTASGSALREMRSQFARWRAEIREADRPWLVGTVSSEANATDRSKGIFRMFVTAEEEAEELAGTAAAQTTRTIGVFYVVRDSSRVSEGYGLTAKQHFEREYRNRGGRATIVAIPVNDDGRDAAEAVEAFLQKGGLDSSVVYVAGYGAMFRSVMVALAAEGYTGPVLAGVQATVHGWHVGSGVPANITTVAPRTNEELKQRKRDLVYLFSWYSAVRAARCLQGAALFDECWLRVTDDDARLGVEISSSGESIIRLRTVAAETATLARR